ncbi:MAG: DUF4835 family protein [Bacteroidetes bacterium]|nr:MAG: DUF4835 family protein [Bacteroidota bacterium]
MIRPLLTMLVAALLPALLAAQELNVTVRINTPKLQLTDPAVFETLEQTIRDFMNNQRWTDDVYAEEERIKVDIVMTISEERSATSFKAELAIQAGRPVYGSTYETPLLSHLDKDVTFTYEQFQPLEFSENSFNDNLSSILSFYAYLIIGLDGDSFAPFGGEPWFQKAYDILNAVPPGVAASNPGWRSLDGNRNRYWIIENLLNPRMRPFRQAWYDYHRLGLDIMHQDPVAGRNVILQALQTIADAARSYPNAMIIQMFANAKSNEIVEIFKPASPAEKVTLRQAMTRIDPANAAKYRNLR